MSIIAGVLKVATNVKTVIPNGLNLYVVSSSDNCIYQVTSNGQAAGKVGAPGLQFVANSSNLYGVSPDGTQVWQYVQAQQWKKLYATTDTLTIQQILADSKNVYAVLSDNNIYNISSGQAVSIGGPGSGSTYLNNSLRLYGLPPGNGNVQRYMSSKWGTIISPSGSDTSFNSVYAAGSAVAALGNSTGLIYFFSDLLQSSSTIAPYTNASIYSIYSGGMFAYQAETGALAYATILEPWEEVIQNLADEGVSSLTTLIPSATYAASSRPVLKGLTLYGLATGGTLYSLATVTLL